MGIRQIHGHAPMHKLRAPVAQRAEGPVQRIPSGLDAFREQAMAMQHPGQSVAGRTRASSPRRKARNLADRELMETASAFPAVGPREATIQVERQ